MNKRMSVHPVVSLIEFPEDLLIEIFSKLSIKCLYLCKRICKHFRYVIEGPEFRCHESLVLLQSGWNKYSWPYLQLNFTMLLMDERTKELVAYKRLDPPAPVFGIAFHHTMVGSCNGLLCFAAWLHYNSDAESQKGDFADFMLQLWNPVTKQSRVIPRHQSKCKPDVLEFGYVWETNDFVIVKVGSPGFRFNLEVYNMSTDSWKIIDSDLFAAANFIILAYNGVFLNGSFHWTIRYCNSDYIAYYKLYDEKLGLINVLDDRSYGFFWRKLLVVDEKLAMKREDVIWVMNDYGIKSSWTPCFKIAETFIDYIGYWANELVLLDGNEVFLYDPKTKSRKTIMSFRKATWMNGCIKGFSSFERTRVPINTGKGSQSIQVSGLHSRSQEKL